ncbi:Hint domain-containing protein [Palleronia sediminis]|uniref:Hint domain-containing protein n=1 Tax=Palleronia sediminis TaxID=2547833 RepID=A0A4R6AJE4_9RHOB|nr:Hint domain-containing protein [Palleronia sediminis]TDL83637.1 Hint domain-containing protein [Palleronia sediminis]
MSARTAPASRPRAACFTPGTRIATPCGEREVETLREGDRIITRDAGIQEICWVGQKRLTHADLVAAPELRPVLIRQGALGYGLPERDTLVSPNHRMLMTMDTRTRYLPEREMLVPAIELCAGPGAAQVEALGMTYIHLMFDCHQMILSNGTWSESFQPSADGMAALNGSQRDEITRLFPGLAGAGPLRDGARFAAARPVLTRGREHDRVH